MELVYTNEALKDIAYWKKTSNKTIQNKITSLIKAIEASPYEGVGKPEALKYELSGFWSRRINKEHRIVYKVVQEKQLIEIHALKGHY